jgi:hypothetical protein
LIYFLRLKTGICQPPFRTIQYTENENPAILSGTHSGGFFSAGERAFFCKNQTFFPFKQEPAEQPSADRQLQTFAQNK